MIAGFQYELIVLPAAAKPQIPACLRSAGIDAAPPSKSPPSKFKGAGTIFSCKENRGSAEILVMDEKSLMPEHRSMVAVLIFPGRGRLADWLCRTTDKALRDKIREILYTLKNGVTSKQE